MSQTNVSACRTKKADGIIRQRLENGGHKRNPGLDQGGVPVTVWQNMGARHCSGVRAIALPDPTEGREARHRTENVPMGQRRAP